MKRLEEAKRVLKVEAEAIIDLSERLDNSFVDAVELIRACTGKVIVSGMGKSGQIGQKIASTLSSTGTPSLFLSPAESVHGDLGVIAKNDIVLAISYGGESDELVPLLKFTSRKNISLIAMTGNVNSTLARASKVTLDIKVKEEACPLKLAPTSSSTVTLALGDALAMAVLKDRGFNEVDYAEFHPGGSLGRKLLTLVKDVMHTGEALPIVGLKESMSTVLGLMTSKEVRGVAGVVDTSDVLVGIITDGDVRRYIDKNHKDPFSLTAEDMMAKSPKTINQTELAQKALFLMEQFSIQTLFVVDPNSQFPNKPVGLIHLQDLLKARIG